MPHCRRTWLTCLGIAGSLSGCVSYDPWQVRRFDVGYNVERACSAEVAVYDHLPPPADRIRLMQWGYNVGPSTAASTWPQPPSTPSNALPPAPPVLPAPPAPTVPTPPQPIDAVNGDGWVPRRSSDSRAATAVQQAHYEREESRSTSDAAWMFVRP